MKVRNGFVSNSSSSSFVVGICGFSKDKLEKTEKFKDDWSVMVFEKDDQGEFDFEGYVQTRDTEAYIESFTYNSARIKDYDKYDCILILDKSQKLYTEDDYYYQKSGLDIGEVFSKHTVEIVDFIIENSGDYISGEGYDG